jgi:Tfp pilus assembly protein PilO
MNRRPALITGIVGVVLAIGLVAGLILPKAAQVKSKQAELEQAVNEEGALQVQLQTLEAAAEEAPQDRKQLKALQKQMPPTADLPGVIRQLNSLSEETGVDFMTIAPGTPLPSPSGSYSIIPIQITVVGGFFAVDQYLFLLEELPRVSKVESIAITPGPDQLPQLSVLLTANFFTTDVSAGPGSVPGATEGTVPAPVTQVPPTGAEGS